MTSTLAPTGRSNAAGRSAEPIGMSATLAAEELLTRRRLAGADVLSMASGEIGLPVQPTIRDRLADAAGHIAYGPVVGSLELRTAAAGYFERRGLPTGPELIVAGPGSKPLLFATVIAAAGDVIVPVPSWVSYAAHAQLAGRSVLRVPIRPGQGGVPDPARLATAVTRSRRAGGNPRLVVVTVPDNPTGNVADEAVLAELAEVARELDLLILSDEIYTDLVYDGRSSVSPARLAPERTIVTTGLTKNLAVGGWRTGVARLPAGDVGLPAAEPQLADRLRSIASQIWSSPPAPIQVAAAYAFDEPPAIREWVGASRRLHGIVARAVAELFRAAGAELDPVRATCYLYPSFAPVRKELARRHDVHNAVELSRLLLERHGVGVIAGPEFGERAGSLRLRASTSQLYGSTDIERSAALHAKNPLTVPWIARSLDRLAEVLSDLTGRAPSTPSAHSPTEGDEG